MNDRQRPDLGRRTYQPDDRVNGRFATRMSAPVARQIALALRGYRLSGAIRAVPRRGRSGPWAVTATGMNWRDYTRAVDYVRGYYWALHDGRWRAAAPRRGRSPAVARRRRKRRPPHP